MVHKSQLLAQPLCKRRLARRRRTCHEHSLLATSIYLVRNLGKLAPLQRLGKPHVLRHSVLAAPLVELSHAPHAKETAPALVLFIHLEHRGIVTHLHDGRYIARNRIPEQHTAIAILLELPHTQDRCIWDYGFVCYVAVVLDSVGVHERLVLGLKQLGSSLIAFLVEVLHRFLIGKRRVLYWNAGIHKVTHLVCKYGDLLLRRVVLIVEAEIESISQGMSNHKMPLWEHQLGGAA